MSELLGNQIIEVANTSRSYGRQGSNSVSYQKTGRKLMDESEIFKLSGDKCLLTIRGADPWCSKKYDIKQHPYYKYLAEADKRNSFDTAKYIKEYKKEKFFKKIGVKKNEDVVRLYFDEELEDAWMISRTYSRKPWQNSWKTVLNRNLMRSLGMNRMT